ncbi:MAG: exosortase A [Alphaproteobacteria bacterium]
MTFEKDTTPAVDRRAWMLATATVLAVFALMGWLFFDAVSGAIRVWNRSETFTHCYLILPVSLYLLWDNRAALARVAPKPMPWVLVLLLPLLVVRLIGDVAGVLELEQLAIVAMAQVVLLAVLGWSVYRVAWFPFLYLFLLVPSGEWLVPVLQDFTADFSVGALRLLGIPTLHDGIFITIPNGNFRVAEACAGLRFLIASIAYGLLFAYMVYRSWQRRLVFVALSFVVPLIANGFRALGIIYLSHVTDNQMAIAADHLVYGWFFFAFVLALLTWIGFGFREDIEAEKTERAAPAGPAPIAGTPFAMVLTGAIAALLVVSGPAYATYIVGQPATTAVALQAPPVAAPWRPTTRDLGGWHIVHRHPDAMLSQSYEADGKLVQLEIAYYAYEREGAELISHNNRLYDDETWKRVASLNGTLAPDGTVLQVRGERLQYAGGSLVVLPFYWVDGHFTASRLRAKLAQVSARLLTGQVAAAQIAVATEAGNDPEAALATLRAFVDKLGPLAPTLAAARAKAP